MTTWEELARHTDRQVWFALDNLLKSYREVIAARYPDRENDIDLVVQTIKEAFIERHELLDEIERLRAENAELRKAFDIIARATPEQAAKLENGEVP